MEDLIWKLGEKKKTVLRIAKPYNMLPMQIAESLSLEVSMCMENIRCSQAGPFHPCNFMILCMIWGETLVSH